MSILALPRDALHWEAAAGAVKLVQGQNSCPGDARVCVHSLAASPQGFRQRAKQKALHSNVRVTSSLVMMHNFSSLWLLFSFLLHWLVSSLLSTMLPDSWMQLDVGGGAGRGEGLWRALGWGLQGWGLRYPLLPGKSALAGPWVPLCSLPERLMGSLLL